MELYKDHDWFFLPMHQMENAKLYPGRLAFLKSLDKNLDILEIGVAAGDFSEQILKECLPKNLYLLDKYDLFDVMFIEHNPRRYEAHEHLDFVTNRFKNYNNVHLLVGDSHDLLPNLNIQFDYIYIDAHHSYENFYKDLKDSIKLLKPNGILGLNDYTYVDENGEIYGVIEVTNRFLKANPDWEITGFALHDRGYNDMYLRRKLNI